jgi:hypothetical protein
MAPKRAVEAQNKQAARLREWRGKTRRNTLQRPHLRYF